MPPMIRKVLIGVLAVLIAVTGGIIISDQVERYRNRKLWQDMREIYSSTEAEPSPLPSPTPQPAASTTTTTIEQTTEPTININFEPLLEINPDIVGWISIEDTPIDYPVVQTDDNSFYLSHDFNKDSSKAGTIFLDYRIEDMLSDPHLILYGHNMRDGSMFHALMQYKEEDFFQEHRTFTFDQLYRQDTWEIFAVYVTTIDFYYIRTSFRSDEDFLDFIAQFQARSMYDTGIEITADDQILTLSTCTYEYDDARFVIHARRVTSG